MADIVFTNESLPEGYCFTGWQRLFNDFTALFHGSLAGECGMFIIQNATPTDADDRNKVWIKLGADGNFERIFLYTNGAWRSPHAMPTGMMVMADYAVNTQVVGSNTYTDFDGGTLTGADPTTDSGPFWQVMYSARFPLSVGTLPSGKAVAVGDESSATEGQETVELGATNMPEHDHFICYNKEVNASTKRNLSGTNYAVRSLVESINEDYDLHSSSTNEESNVGLTSKAGGSSGSTVAHNNMPPYFGTYFLRRTSRIYYTS